MPELVRGGTVVGCVVNNRRTFEMEAIVGMQWVWLALLGLLGGTFGALLGLGGGIFLVPALVMLMHMPQKVAQGTCLAVMVPMALMSALRYHWNPGIKLNIGVILLLAVFAVVGANIGSTLAAKLPALVLQRIFGVVVILVGVRMLWR
ncbi:MAG: putative membrane protein YfcA [Candidatus Promineifilaceae bacterium]|jgi:uncharacterized protein